jgi:hypothetical protein
MESILNWQSSHLLPRKAMLEELSIKQLAKKRAESEMFLKAFL